MGDIPYEVLQQGGFVGPDFHGVFFFQNVYWRVVIPLVFGTCSLKPFDALATMPAQVRRYLESSHQRGREYILLWADCLDYGLRFGTAINDLSAKPFVEEMAKSVDRELRSAIAELCQKNPNPNAMYSARHCVEKALKGFLSFQTGLTAEKAKSEFGHNLGRLMKEIKHLCPNSELISIENQLDAFAPYQDQYSGRSFTRDELWHAYRLAQFAAAELARAISGRNQRAVIHKSLQNIQQ